MQSPAQRQRSYGAIRTALIGYGVAIFSYLMARPDAGVAKAMGSDTSALTFVVWGVLVQVALMAARALIDRFIADRELAAQALAVAELIGDGATVLLFALSTLGAIMGVASDI